MTLPKRGALVGAWTPLAALALLCVPVGTGAFAQSASGLDADSIEQLQKRLTAGGVATGSSPNAIDDSRARAEQTSQNPQQILGSGTLDFKTSEEVLEQRQRARELAAQLYEPSPVEREYQERLGDPSLRQFGYDLFSGAIALQGQATGEMSDSYLLGVGDELVVTLQGATNESQTVRVNRDGNIIIGALRPIRAAGRSLGSVRSEISALTRETLLGTSAYTSVGAIRAVTVFVGGEVNRPGQVRLTSQSDIVSALASADGIRKTGSLRRIQVVRGGRTIIVDLYGLVGIGSTAPARLQDGDRIVVPVIGPTIAITGGVSRPGIYELRGEIDAGDAVAYAGGAVRARGSKVSISRIGADGSEDFVKVSGTSQLVISGDAIIVTGGSAGGALNRVALRGNVTNPGPRPLPGAPTVRDLLGSIHNLKADTYLPMAVLVRRNLVAGGIDYDPVNLVSALGSGSPVPLRSDDTLWVFSQKDIQFLNTAAVRQIILGQSNPLPQCRALDRLVETVRDTQSSRFSAITRGSYIVDREGRSSAAAIGGSALSSGVRFGASGAETAIDQGVTACPDVFEANPALVPVLIENAVGISGNVRRPGAYPVAGTVTAEIAASVAEGVTSLSEEIVLDVTSGRTGTVTTDRFAVDADRQVMARVTLHPGDDIRINGGQTQFESAAVLLTGEFSRPGLYSIRKGETLSQLMQRAGGVTSQAYPYGTIMTRRSVKQVQEEGFRRSARDMNNGVLAIAARKNVDAGGLAAATQVIETLSKAESAGRMVVEADPQVLAQRPELDTVLEGGDAVFMPKKPNYVLVVGDVANPGAVQHQAGQTVKHYVADAGGEQFSADDDRIYVLYPNGLARPVKRSMWRSNNSAIPPGSTVIVPKNLDPLFALDFAQSLTSIVGSVISSIASLVILARD